jgi:hypothetical protein
LRARARLLIRQSRLFVIHPKARCHLAAVVIFVIFAPVLSLLSRNMPLGMLGQSGRGGSSDITFIRDPSRRVDSSRSLFEATTQKRKSGTTGTP